MTRVATGVDPIDRPAAIQAEVTTDMTGGDGAVQLTAPRGRITTRGMLDHLAIQCDDVEKSAAFYDAVLATIGGQRILEFPGPTIGYGVPPMPDFWLGPRETGNGFRESHIAFTAPDREAVDRFRQAAIDAGAEVLHEPKMWPEYHPNYYGVFVRDPDGNNVEAVCHSPEV